MGGPKMAKSAKNIKRVTDLAAEGIDPLAYRLLCFGTRYRSEMEFSWEALEGANRRLVELRRRMAAWAPAAGRSDAAAELDARFRDAIAADLDMPHAVVVLNEAVSSDLPGGEKYALLASWDAVLALDLERDALGERWEPSEEMRALVAERDAARATKDYARSDELRDRLQAMGLEVMDRAGGTEVRPSR
jgi:cysteinyl-tRNA synthetase